MLSLTSELQVGAKLRKNAEDIIQERRNVFNHLSSKRIEIPHHVQKAVSKFLTTRVRRKNTKDKCSVINTLCCGRMKQKLLDKKYIELYDKDREKYIGFSLKQNLSIYKMVNKLLEEEILLLGKVYSDTIKNINFHNLTDLFEYHIETNDVEMRSNKNKLDDEIRSFSPVSSDDEKGENNSDIVEINSNSLDIENIVLDVNETNKGSIELTSLSQDNIYSEEFVEEMKEFVDVSANNALQN